MKLTVGDDLKAVHELITRVRQHYPQHLGNIRKISHNVDRYISEYHTALWQYTRSPCDKYRDQAQQALNSIAALLTVLERIELLGYLSGNGQQRP